jgi:hypothetical protein
MDAHIQLGEDQQQKQQEIYRYLKTTPCTSMTSDHINPELNIHG